MRVSARSGSELKAKARGMSSADCIPAALATELRRIQGIGLGAALGEVLWRPGGRADVDAEVLDRVVLVYAREFDVAMDALRHEVLHFEIAECRKPLLELVNAVLAAVNEEAYHREERLISRLAVLLDS